MTRALVRPIDNVIADSNWRRVLAGVGVEIVTASGDFNAAIPLAETELTNLVLPSSQGQALMYVSLFVRNPGVLLSDNFSYRIRDASVTGPLKNTFTPFQGVVAGDNQQFSYIFWDVSPLYQYSLTHQRLANVTNPMLGQWQAIVILFRE
jgi:hypothetical protein